MGKEKLEVGGVWEYQDKLYHISKITDRYVEVWCKSSDTQMNRHNWLLSSFVGRFTYKGKSKVNINDLFEAEQ